MIPLICPHCRTPIAEPACRRCGATYRTLRGIPDLRTAEDAFLSNADDWAYAQRLDEGSDGLDFRSLLDRYFDLSPEIAPDLRTRQIDHILTAAPRASDWVARLGNVPEGPWLDLGCGSGSFLAAVAEEVPEMVGIDVAMRWLLVARKRLDEAGLARVRLVCGNAEGLPFPDRSFAAVLAGDVIEHVADQAATLSEAHRVLIPGGKLFMATPNRLSLAPEPHVGVWGVGFLPRSWMAPYVRMVRNADFRAIRTLSSFGWTRVLRESPFVYGRIDSPPLPDADLASMSGLKRFLARSYNRLVATEPGRSVLRAVGPLFHIVATRLDSSPSPPPRRSTRP